jgi:3-methylfumaryl-CoA hydratase
MDTQVVEEVDVVSAGAAMALHGLLDAPGQAPVEGELIPPLWHWLAFLPRVPQREVGPDGHPSRKSDSQLEKYPQRMFAGAKISILGHARIGHQLTRSTRKISEIKKSGRTGPLLFTTIEHVIRCDGEVVINEIQDIVYRGPSPNSNGIIERPKTDESLEWTMEDELITDPIVLFRFSALTYNSHRIHYDLNYSRAIEGHPDLVVQGPLKAIALAEVCRRHVGNRSIASFSFRALRPSYCGEPIKLLARYQDEDHLELITAENSGVRTMEARASLHPAHH